MLWGSPTIVEDLSDYPHFIALALDELQRIASLTGSRLLETESLYEQLRGAVVDYSRFILNIKRLAGLVPHNAAQAAAAALLQAIHQNVHTIELVSIPDAPRDDFVVAMCHISCPGYFAHEFCFKFFASVWSVYYSAERSGITVDWRPLIETCVRLFSEGDLSMIVEAFRARVMAEQRRSLGS